jgi:hypothetical protein
MKNRRTLGHAPDDEDLPLEQVVVVDEPGREAVDRPLTELYEGQTCARIRSEGQYTQPERKGQTKALQVARAQAARPAVDGRGPVATCCAPQRRQSSAKISQATGLTHQLPPEDDAGVARLGRA